MLSATCSVGSTVRNQLNGEGKFVLKVAADPGYHWAVEDIKAWEAEHGRILEGAVVMVRSDWRKRYPLRRDKNGAMRPLPILSIEEEVAKRGATLPDLFFYFSGRW